MGATVGLYFQSPEEEMQFCMATLEKASAQYYMELTEGVSNYLENVSSESSMVVAVTEAEHAFLEKIKAIFRKFKEAFVAFISRTKANIQKYQADKDLAEKIKVVDMLITRGKGAEVASKHFKDYDPKRTLIKREKEDFLKFLHGKPTPEKLTERIKEFWSKLSVQTKTTAVVTVGVPVTVAALKGFIAGFKKETENFSEDVKENADKMMDIIQSSLVSSVKSSATSVIESASDMDLTEQEVTAMANQSLQFMIELDQEYAKTLLQTQTEIFEAVTEASEILEKELGRGTDA